MITVYLLEPLPNEIRTPTLAMNICWLAMFPPCGITSGTALEEVEDAEELVAVAVEDTELESLTESLVEVGSGDEVLCSRVVSGTRKKRKGRLD